MFERIEKKKPDPLIGGGKLRANLQFTEKTGLKLLNLVHIAHQMLLFGGLQPAGPLQRHQIQCDEIPQVGHILPLGLENVHHNCMPIRIMGGGRLKKSLLRVGLQVAHRREGGVRSASRAATVKVIGAVGGFAGAGDFVHEIAGEPAQNTVQLALPPAAFGRVFQNNQVALLERNLIGATLFKIIISDCSPHRLLRHRRPGKIRPRFRHGGEDRQGGAGGDRCGARCARIVGGGDRGVEGFEACQDFGEICARVVFGGLEEMRFIQRERLTAADEFSEIGNCFVFILGGVSANVENRAGLDFVQKITQNDAITEVCDNFLIRRLL
eukprot:Sdes_comp20949_c0_seq1m18573